MSKPNEKSEVAKDEAEGMLPSPAPPAYPRNPPPGVVAPAFPPAAPYPGYQQQPPSYPGYPQPGGYPTQGMNPLQAYHPGSGYVAYLPTGHPGGPPPPPGPITSQPTATGDAVTWMQTPQGTFNCPPGLEYLTLIDQLLVKQKVKLAELMTGFGFPNEYSILNTAGQCVYEAVEVSSFVAQNCLCKDKRTFDMKLFDISRNMAIHVHRPRSCKSCCFPCCLQYMEVTAPPGTLVGTIHQQWSLCRNKLEVKDTEGKVQFIIKGPACCVCGFSNVEFPVLSADGKSQVGAITKQWAGIVQESYSDADNFSVSFPVDLDVKMKAVLLGACFLIDFMFFENCANSRPRHNRR